MKVELVAKTVPVVEGLETAQDLVSYAARVSNPSNQLNTETGGGLLRYCIKHKHFSVFETVNLVMSIETTRDIGRQILRHRSFCLGGDSQIWFDLPNEEGKSSRKFLPYQKSISYLHDRWFNGAEELPNGQRIPMRDRIKNMKIRCMNEETGEIVHTHINDITKSEAHLHKVSFDNGNVVLSSKDHRYYTEDGWLPLEEALENKVRFVCQTSKADKPEQYFPDINSEDEEWLPVDGWENYMVSNMGRVKRVGKYSTGKIRKGSVGNHGYPRVSFNKPAVQEDENMHRLVLKTFQPLDCYEGMQVRHKNHNKLDCRLENLEWGTDKENKKDTYNNDTHGRLRTGFCSVVSVEDVGVQECYDISVEAPWHNFICDGQVVHNSFQEFSQRYAEVDPEIVYRETRLQDTKNKQNSIISEDIRLDNNFKVNQDNVFEAAISAYNNALDNGIAKEQARALLPEGLVKTHMYMNGTLRSWLHFCQVRCGVETQKECSLIAKEACRVIIKEFPVLVELLSPLLEDDYSAET